MGKNPENMPQKLVPDHYLIQETLLKKYIFKENNPKSSKNLTLFLFFNSVSFYGNYNDK